jgi:hypothetical protein
MREVTLDEREGLRIWATTREDGALVVCGRDTRMSPWGPSDSEYALTVAPEDVGRVAAALGGDGDLLDMLEARARDIVLTGERAWFRSIGIEPEFWSRED